MTVEKTISETGRPDAGGYFFRVWERSESFVPNPWLYMMAFFPRQGLVEPGLNSLRRFEFIYRVTTDFVARVIGEEHEIARVSLEREAMGFRLNTINGRSNLITPEAAERRLIRHLEERWRELGAKMGVSSETGTEFTPMLEPFWEMPWSCLRLEQPLKAGVIEPSYLFSKADCPWEFRVGARSGSVNIARPQTTSLA